MKKDEVLMYLEGECPPCKCKLLDLISSTSHAQSMGCVRGKRLIFWTRWCRKALLHRWHLRETMNEEYSKYVGEEASKSIVDIVEDDHASCVVQQLAGG